MRSISRASTSSSGIVSGPANAPTMSGNTSGSIEASSPAISSRRAERLSPAVALRTRGFRSEEGKDICLTPPNTRSMLFGSDAVAGRRRSSWRNHEVATQCQDEAGELIARSRAPNPCAGQRGPLRHRGLQRQHIEGAHPVALAGEAQAAEILRRDEISHFVVGRLVDEDLTRAGRRL